jgi:hexosaminidase
VFQQVCALFPHSPYIHIGGDEVLKTRWRSCLDCQQRIRKDDLKSEDELQCWFVRRIASMLKAMDRQIIGWDEILEGTLFNSTFILFQAVNWKRERRLCNLGAVTPEVQRRLDTAFVPS